MAEHICKTEYAFFCLGGSGDSTSLFGHTLFRAHVGNDDLACMTATSSENGGIACQIMCSIRCVYGEVQSNFVTGAKPNNKNTHEAQIGTSVWQRQKSCEHPYVCMGPIVRTARRRAKRQCVPLIFVCGGISQTQLKLKLAHLVVEAK